MKWCLTMLAALFLSTSAVAVQPDEKLSDAALESRAREISLNLRCLVCQNESIDESEASVARDLRILIREQLVAGKSNAEIHDFVVARYGTYVLLKPPFTFSTMFLWLTPFVMLLVASILLWQRSSRQAAFQTNTESLSDGEESRLIAILQQEKGK
jgi:cytochrome c-type biogenesis protein CcmH